MAMMQMWDNKKGLNHQFIDGQIKEMFRIGGCVALCHKYIGVYDQGESGDVTLPSNAASTKKGIRQIQDLFFLENRDRAYDSSVYELRGAYNTQDYEFNISQFALFMDGDTLYLEFQISDVLEKIGRTLMSGDVLEFPHLRDDMLLEEDAPAVNKFYVIQDVSRAAGGWAQNWRPYLFRVKMKPLTDSQEYKDILNGAAIGPDGEETDFSVRDLISDAGFWDEVSDALSTEAENEVPYRNFQTAQFYVIPGDEMGKQYPWIFAGDGLPPNGAELAGSGTSFPESPTPGDWFLHTSMNPYVLYQFVGNTTTNPFGDAIPADGGTWQRREVDFRMKWQAAHRILQSFINNDNVNTIHGDLVQEKVMLSKALKPKADF